jgi:hypothetical protein
MDAPETEKLVQMVQAQGFSRESRPSREGAGVRPSGP